MADYQEVMRQRRRMCAAYAPNCIGCEVREEQGGKMCTAWFCCEPARAEEITMRWAAGHPEPRYPTWREAINSVFPKLVNMPVTSCPHMLFSDGPASELCPERQCSSCWNTPIPTDIAEKLGVKPIEDSNHGQ